MIPILSAAAAGCGVFLLVFQKQSSDRAKTWRSGLAKRGREWLAQAGLVGIRPAEFAGVMGALTVVGFVTGFAIFSAAIPAAAIAAAFACIPASVYRTRRQTRMSLANEAWPTLIEEIRLHTSTLGRSIPQALFDVGHRAPLELRPSFAAAQREWLLTMDFPRTLDVLKAQLADPTADATCETLLVSHETGGSDLNRRLEALAEDRLADATARKDARARQAGVRLARRFVLVVPAGMALAGSLIGNGRAAYGTGLGQVVVLVAIALIGTCWIWAGRFLRLPAQSRVFGAGAAAEVLP